MASRWRSTPDPKVADHIFEPTAFVGRDPSAHRYVWDQNVHHWHGDRCYIILLALPEVTDGSREEVEALIGSLGILSQSCYLAYGSYDIVLRVWCTPYDREALIRKLDERYQYPETEVFVVEDIDYSRWSSVAEIADEERVVTHLDTIRALVADPEDDVLARQLVGLGLLHEHEFDTADDDVQVRVYILLRRRTDAVGRSAALWSAIQAALGTLDFLNMPSVYYGSSRTIDCIIKGFVSAAHLPTLHRDVIALRKSLADRQVDLRPMTLILAHDGETDRDILRLEPHAMEDPDVRRLKANLSREAADAFDALDEDLRERVVADFTEAWPSTSESSFARALLDLIEGVVLDDAYQVNGSLAFLIQAEAQFRRATVSRLLPSLAPEVPDWRRPLQESLQVAANHADEVLADEVLAAAFKVAVQRLEEPGKLGFGELLKVVESLVRADVVSRADVERQLGASLNALHGVVEARNAYAHGNMFFNPGDRALQWWTQHATAVLTAGKVLAGLDRVELT